ncbi:hypothetical protein H6G20_00285 [Desertifilum sp. FACHB-1129]|uniref:Uncharacterized protein n=2 Tax=Desertifilum tharense IPPAS B-1220 TaxID=1781255 RepID=A0A1E5QFZ1_9CYAN|nr:MULTISPECIES: Imm1 family immunity protein [Desertifilum]MDA0211595.1 Imm1 family immunity protein [Cyanobacteria bacterium FC1]MBD2310119.1 hypothetical protein [Desertifilum sp. FACHB-1129]MBD2322077.1 hypothetical protein [Desertifilum sp. FACHB-866]MBD2333844.1 hypothetical protein [Desertifilum sp. FACHB-868]OEJ73504.1 hypothetical protein BH720_19965 [Desertifilum tharense IPPAS B-1220]
MSVEQWVSNLTEENFIENPSWDLIEIAIRELDGKSKTLVTLGTDSEAYLTVGGGEAGKYIVTATFDNLDFYNLVNSAADGEIESILIGGQAGDYPAKMHVDLLSCLLAARTFTHSGELDSLLTWEADRLLVSVG